jgi:hypothetical protein
MSIDRAYSSRLWAAIIGGVVLVLLAPGLARSGVTERGRFDRVLDEGGDWSPT